MVPKYPVLTHKKEEKSHETRKKHLFSTCTYNTKCNRMQVIHPDQFRVQIKGTIIHKVKTIKESLNSEITKQTDLHQKFKEDVSSEYKIRERSTSTSVGLKIDSLTHFPPSVIHSKEVNFPENDSLIFMKQRFCFIFLNCRTN